ncbi:unnamed protein product [Malus baccata var. baccata]
MDTAQWLQGSGELEKPMEDHEMGSNGCTRSVLEKRARPQEQLNCPRCSSTNTKFCYYNNYSLTQPRYFCKTCRRYWTEGGTLRNVPVGGGSRKNKKSTSSSASVSSKITIPDLNPPTTLSHFSSSHQNPRVTHEGQDLKLTFDSIDAHYHGTTMENNNNTNSSSAPNLSAMELLRTGIASRGVNSFMPTQNMPDHHSNTVLYPPSSVGFSLQEFKPTSLGFCVDGLGNRYGGDDHENVNGGRILFPFGDHHLKQISSTAGHHEVLDHHQNKGQGNPTGYWNGLLGGGSW